MASLSPKKQTKTKKSKFNFELKKWLHLSLNGKSCPRALPRPHLEASGGTVNAALPSKSGHFSFTRSLLLGKVPQNTPYPIALITEVPQNTRDSIALITEVLQNTRDSIALAHGQPEPQKAQKNTTTKIRITLL